MCANMDTQRHVCYHESSVLTINVMREDTIENRLEDAFQFDRSSSLAFNKLDISTNNNNNDNNNNMHSDT